MNRQEHLIMVLGEEGCEVAQMASKINRFGIDEIFPGQPLTNAERMHLELDDLQAMIELANENCGLGYVVNRTNVKAKKAKVMKYMAYSESLHLITA
jgi:hypothetical protein